MISNSAAPETCGAWPELGGCTRPSGHNMGQADVPTAHAFPPGVRYTAVHLPVLDGDERPGAEFETRTCKLCEREIDPGPSGFLANLEGHPPDKVVVSASFGTVHAECYLSELRMVSVQDAWVVIALEIAKRPSKHTASEIRAALTSLATIIRKVT